MTIADEYCLRPAARLAEAMPDRGNPLDVFERIAIAEHFEFERVKPEEIHITLPGLWCHHDLILTWDAEPESISLFLAFDGRSPGGRSDDMCRLMSLINERLTHGHFDFWHQSNALVYRHSHSLRGGAKLLIEQAQDLITQALDAAERGYPATQYVIWAGKSPEDALTSALVDLAANP